MTHVRKNVLDTVFELDYCDKDALNRVIDVVGLALSGNCHYDVRQFQVQNMHIGTSCAQVLMYIPESCDYTNADVRSFEQKMIDNLKSEPIECSKTGSMFVIEMKSCDRVVRAVCDLKYRILTLIVERKDR